MFYPQFIKYIISGEDIVIRVNLLPLIKKGIIKFFINEPFQIRTGTTLIDNYVL